MGSMISSAFIDPADLPGCSVDMTGVKEGEEGVLTCLAPFSEPEWAWGLIQVLTLMALYGYVLFYSSNMLSEGSELLLLVPSLAGIVGSVVLPILGAVPDGAIMLFSGLGPNAQEELTVGIGAIAGSTVMLLTIPWGLSIIMGRVPLRSDGTANYKKKGHVSGASFLTGYGVMPETSIRSNALIMVVTSLIYLIIQGPAFAYATDTSAGTIPKLSRKEHWFSLAGLVCAIVAFFGYIYLMTAQSTGGTAANTEFLINQASIKAIEGDGSVTLAGVIAPIIEQSTATLSERSGKDGLAAFSGPLLDDHGKARLTSLLRPFFKKYDVDGNGKISSLELIDLLKSLGEDVTPDEAKLWMHRLDPDRSGDIETDQFTDAMLNYISEKAMGQSSAAVRPAGGGSPGSTVGDGSDEEDEEDEEEMPEELKHLSPAEQQRLIKRKAFGMMLVGLTLILVFSDPMVDVMSNVGARIGVPPFYVSFVLAPLASNASELIASLTYAAKKTRKTITVSLAALEGAACMNNTFCLAIFMALVFFKGLAWKFTAETITILIVECLVALVATLPTQRVWHAFLLLALFPASIALVAVLEGAGFD